MITRKMTRTPIENLQHKLAIGGLSLLWKPILWLMDQSGNTADFLANSLKTEESNNRIKQSFAGYTPTKQDVFVCAYAKSGTNWMMQMAHQIAWLGQAEFEHIHDVVAWPDSYTPNYAIDLNDRTPADQSPTNQRIIKTHLAWQDLPYSSDAKYICVLRDPKDVCVSAYHFARDTALGPMTPSVSAWVDWFTNGRFLFGNWDDIVPSYWEAQKQPNVLLVTYQQMKENMDDVIRQVAHFMDVQLTDEQFADVHVKCTYQYMKAHDKQFATGILGITSSEDGAMVRKGVKGGSSELLTTTQQKRIDKYFRKQLKKKNSDLPYAELFSTPA